jgi:hypothetical protein
MSQRRRNPERGSAMIVTLIVTSALLAGAAVLASMQLSSTRSSDLARSGLSSLNCAEAGLSIARPVVAANYNQWTATLATYPSTAEPTWLSTGINATACTYTGNCHDLDGDGVTDFVVYIKDNDDEVFPIANDYTKDNDLRIWIVSKCTKYSDTVQEVEELIQWSGGGTKYNDQAGGAAGNGNVTGASVQ